MTVPATTGRRLAVLTALLGGFTAFGPLSMDLYLPAFPQMAAELRTGEAAVQATLTADVVGLIVGQLVLGPLSDARGRRRVLIGSTLVCAAASVLCALAPSVGRLTLWRVVQGAAGGGGIVLARAVAADLTTGVAAARLFALFMTVSSVAPILAPVLGGALLAATGSWRPMFWVLAGTSVVLAGTAWRLLPETLAPEHRRSGGLRSTGRAVVDLARDRVFVGYAATVALAYASLFGYLAASSFVLQEVYGLSATWYSLAFALNAVGSVALGLLNARLVRFHAVRRILVVGLAVSAVAAAALVAAVLGGGGLLVVLVPLFLVVASRGLVSANATVLGIGRAASAGSASAVLGACMFAGGVVVTPLLALGGEGTALPMAVVVAGAAVAALLATVLLTGRAAGPG